MKNESSVTKHHIVVAATVRDVADNIEASVDILQQSLQDFAIVSWYIVESDSNDDTGKVLFDLSQRIPNFHYEELGALRTHFPARTERIAYCRNKYIEAFEEDPRFFDADYLCVADMDGVINGLGYDGIDSCWEREDWAACCANHMPYYYDIWALRHKTWCPGDCWLTVNEKIDNGFGAYYAYISCVYQKMIEIDRAGDWIEVDSAFGGIALYRRSAIFGARYLGLLDGRQICEHVGFNKSVRGNGGAILINPRLVIRGGFEHQKYLGWFGRLRLWIYLNFRTLIGKDVKQILNI